MIPHDLIPPALRSASVEEQLSYLLQRRVNIERLLASLEKYARQRDGALPEGQSSTGVAA